MKILVISDTHGQRSAAEKAYLAEEPDIVAFLGDGQDDMAHLRRLFPAVNMFTVKGNCDFFADAPLYICETWGGVRVYACHGHRHDVKNGLSPLAYAASSMSADLALFGHTHRQDFRIENGVALLNPGSLGFGGTYAVVTAEDGAFKYELKSL